MVFHDKFELLAIRNGDREIALAGREILSGRPIVVHLLGGPQLTDVRRLLDQLNGLRAEERQLVLEIGDHEGIPYVVTAVLPGKLGIQSWIDSVQPLVSTEVSLAAPAEEPAQAAPVVLASGHSALEQEPAGGQPGEFTRLFATAPSSEVECPKVPEAPAPAQPATAGPGDFTRMLRSPLDAADGRAARPEPEPVRRASKFTRIIQVDELPPMPGNDRRSAPGRESSAHPALTAGGGMTRMLESPLEYAADSVPPSGPLRTAAATGAVAVVGQEASREPGEFTRIFVMSPDAAPAQALATSPEPPKPAVQPAAPPLTPYLPPRAQMPPAANPAMIKPRSGAQSMVDGARRKKNKLPLLVILASLSLVFVLVILVFALMR